MLTVAYCRVSTDEQAEEGYSIEGQADKARLYAQMRGLGEVTVITDPGISGKNLTRPGLQQLLAAVEAGHVAHVVIWRLDRLSRNLNDLILLADLFGQHGVGFHSVTESLDLSSAAGRMFYNILGTFAQYYREHLSENVKMGMERAIREGRNPNRPKMGYDMRDGLMYPNDDAVRVREVFRLRAEGMSYRAIQERVGVKYSTVKSILDSRTYLGEVPHNGEWFPGLHEPLLSEEEWRAAHSRHTKGVRRSRDVLSGRVVCGLCGKRMSVQQNGQGSVTYKCYSRGQGCDQPSRSNKGLARAVVLGLSLLRTDESLLAAIRGRLTRRARPAVGRPRRGRGQSPADLLAELSERRRMLLDLYYAKKITAEGFEEEEQHLCASIEAARGQVAQEDASHLQATELEARFERVATILQELDIERIWAAATDEQRHVLISELLESVKVFPDHLEVVVSGVPPLNVLYGEVGMKDSETVGVGDGT